MIIDAFQLFLNKLSEFKLDLISQEWIEYMWNREFPSGAEIPSDYEVQVDGNFIDLIREARANLYAWLNEDPDPNLSVNTRDSIVQRKSWNVLAQEVNHRALLSLIAAFVRNYDSDPSEYNDDVRHVNERAFEAARFYFLLISFEGAHIFKVFQGVIYHQCLELFKSVAFVNTQPKETNKGRGRKRQSIEDDDDEPYQNGHSVNVDRLREVKIKSCCYLIEDLSCCLNKFSLSVDEGELNNTVQTMVQMAGCERHDNSFYLNNKPTRRNTTYLAYMAYSNIENLCREFHGPVVETLKLVMKNILPCVGIFDVQLGQQLSKENIVVKDHSIKFLLKLVKKLKEISYIPMYTFVQQLCFKVPDKADIRTKYVDVVVDIIFQFPFDLYYKTLLFLCRLCLLDTVKLRILGAEIVAKVFSLPPKDRLDDTLISDGTDSRRTSSNSKSSIASTASSSNASSVGPSIPQFLFALIINSCRDVSPRIRIKTLSILSHVLRSTEYHIILHVENVFTINVDHEVKELYNFNQFFRNKQDDESALPSVVPTAGTVINLIETLVHDSKALVRKNALHVVSDVCLLHPQWITKERLNILVSSCKDFSVGNRKLMAQCLTDLLDKWPENDLVINAWVEGVVPLFTENEVKSQEKFLELGASIILENIVPRDKIRSPKERLPWKIISLIFKYNMRKLFKFACQQWFNREGVRKPLIKSLETYIGSENNFAAWYLLVCISEFQNLPNPETVLNYFYEKVFDQSHMDELESQLIMQALVLNWKQLKKDQICELCLKLRNSIISYEIPLPLVSGSLEIIHLNDKEGARNFARQLILDCQERIKTRIKAVVSKECYSDTLLCLYIATLGEACPMSPGVVDKETIKALADLIDLAKIDTANQEKVISTLGHVHNVTVVTLGRLCLQDQFTAKEVVPILGALVSAKTPSGIKNNVNIALTDLCMRFSFLVEPYFGDMLICLKDPDPVIRRNTLNLLCILIQEQFLKIKPHIFVYLLSMLHDQNARIKDVASNFLVNSLMAKEPNIVFNNFTQAIFFFNCYEGKCSIAEKISPIEKATFCLAGDENTELRRSLLLFLVQHMDDALKYKTKNRICSDILKLIAEGVITMDKKGVTILKDSLFILSCDEIKFSSRKGGKDGDPDDEADLEFEKDVAMKKRIESVIFCTIYTKHLQQDIIPCLQELKNKLISLKSPLVTDVMECLKEILKDFNKEQVKEILGSDVELAAEVLHDIRREEQEVGPNVQDSPRDPDMEQIEHFAKEISCKVILRASSAISADNVEVRIFK